jgi:hypothetical protein
MSKVNQSDLMFVINENTGLSSNNYDNIVDLTEIVCTISSDKNKTQNKDLPHNLVTTRRCVFDT